MRHRLASFDRYRSPGSLGLLAALAVLVGTADSPALGGLSYYFDESSWLDAVPDAVIINFDEFPHGTTITDQYAPLGVTFPTGAVIANWSVFETDGRGLFAGSPPNQPPSPFILDFSTPIHSIASVFPGENKYWLYMDDVLVGETGFFVPPFLGIVSDLPFNKVVMDNTGVNTMDTLYFGTFVPAPGAVVILGLAGLVPGRRRRRVSER